MAAEMQMDGTYIHGMWHPCNFSGTTNHGLHYKKTVGFRLENIYVSQCICLMFWNTDNESCYNDTKYKDSQ